MPLLLCLQKLQGKGDGGWKKVFLHHFFSLHAWSETNLCENAFMGHPIAGAKSYCLLPDTF